MKEFFKWLGVNEKIAKIVVWILIMMVCLIIINVFLESIGAPYYGLTVDNLNGINKNQLEEYIISCIVGLLNFYSIVLLVFRVEKAKKLLKHALIYIVVISMLTFALKDFNYYALIQIFIISYMLLFCYLYSDKKLKYMFYGLISVLVNITIQYIWYLYKARFVEFNNIGQTNRLLTSVDFYIIMFFIILIKEIYLKRRGDNNATNSKLIMASNIQKRSKISKETSKNVNEVKDKS